MQWEGTRCSIVNWGTVLQAGKSQVRVLMGVIEFVSMYLILPVALGPGVHLAFNRNEYQKQKNYASGK
jgi:hypothetical protein